MIWRHTRRENGQTLIEVLVALGLLGILLPALATGLVAAREGKAHESQRLAATALLREADEAVRSVREKGWSQLSSNGTYYPVVSGSSWSLAAGSETTNGFTRQVVVSDVQRNASGVIVPSGGTVDPSTKKVVTTVSWQTPFPQSVSNESYYSRFLNNAAWTQTSTADFTAGTTANTSISATNGGQVELSPIAGAPTWGSLRVTGSYNSSVTNDATATFISGTYLYLTAGPTLFIFNLATPGTPTLAGSYSTTSTTTITDVFVSGNYAYLSTTADTGELLTVNVTNKAAPTLTNTFNLGDAANAQSIFIDGTYAYIGKISATSTNRELYIVNIATPTSPSITGSYEHAGSVMGVQVSGNYAYLATTHDTQELVVLNITNKAAPSLAGSFDLPSSTADATRLTTVGTTVYLTTLASSTGPEFNIINAATPGAMSRTGSFELGANATDVAVSGNYAFVTGARSTKQLSILNITTPSAPSENSSINLTTTTNSVAVSGEYAYIASTEDARELVVVKNGTTGAGGYQASGAFESSSFDAGAPAAFNYLNFTLTEPAGSEVLVQIAVNTDNATWNYVGPDGTSSTFYQTSGGVPLAATAARYIRYKVTFTGNGTITPVLQDVAVNYSP